MFYTHRQTVENRYNDNGIVGTLTDIEILRNCNFFVGTFSSNVCLLDFQNFFEVYNFKSNCMAS